MEYKFSEFITRKKREAIKQLSILKKLLEVSGFRISNFLDENFDDSEPYIFCYNAEQDPSSFEGIRIYKIGDQIAFRIQKQDKTHPFGKAYIIPVEEMFNYFLEDMNEKEAGEEIIKMISKEIRTFFEKCRRAENDLMQGSFEGQDSLTVRTTGTDYSAQIYNKS